MTTVYILGALDPEMREIERVLSCEGAMVFYAGTDAWQATPANASRSTHLWPLTNGPWPATVFRPGNTQIVTIECDFGDAITPHLRIDHHSPGDPGYGMPPDRYMEGSSLGQLLQYLGLVPTSEQRIIAAADHCLSHAYAGKCPGVEPSELLEWRINSRATFQKRDPNDIRRDITIAQQKLRAASSITLAGIAACDMRGPFVPELVEAAMVLGVSYVAGPFKDRSGEKFTASSPNPEFLREWMGEWAPAQGLINIYGDPVRGFAGGYRK